MKGCSKLGRISFFVFALSFLLLQDRETSAGIYNPDFINLTFFVRTNAASGFTVTRFFNLHQGPVDNQRFFTGVRVVPSGVENEWLGIENGNVIRVRSDGSTTAEEAPRLGLNDSPSALTFDPAHRRALAATISGEGSLFNRPADEPWSLLGSMNNVDLAGMAYYPPDDVIWGLRSYSESPNGPAILTKFSAAGAKLEDFSTNGFPVNIGPGQFACEMQYFLGWGQNIAVLVAKPYSGTPAPEESAFIYTFEPKSGQFYLDREVTYIPAAPSVQFTVPYSTNELLTLGTAFTFDVAAFDIDADLQTIELMDNGSVFKTSTFDPLPYALTNDVSATWTASDEGLHTITARARDGRGLVTETSITINVVGVRVERSLPGTRVFAGQTISVSLEARAATGTQPWTVKERPPADWTISPDSEGTLDPVRHEITWGPFSDGAQRTLTYQLTAPVSSSLSNFVGEASVNGASTPIVGASALQIVPPHTPAVRFVSFDNSQTQFAPGTAFPIWFEVSDGDGDLRAVELRCNGALIGQWNFGAVWQAYTNSIRTNWTTYVGGHFNFSARAEDALGNVAEQSSTLDVILDSGVFVFRTLPTNVIAGQSFTVTLIASPTASAPAWTVKEQPPAGWTVRVGAEASVDPESQEITWGPFGSPQVQRTLTYDVTAPVAGTSATFAGRVLIEGASNAILGRTNTYVLPPTETAVQWIDAQHVKLNFNAFPGIYFVVESADALNATTWTQVRIVLGGDTPIQVGPIEVPNQQLFFRLRPL